MSDNPLQLTFANREDVTDPYWLRMEIVEDDTTMTVKEAADIIDQLYHTSPCNKAEEPATIVEPTAPDWDAILAQMNLPYCQNQESLQEGDNGAYDTKIRVYRSHQDEIYKLVMSNGTASGPTRTEERVIEILEIEDLSSITLDKPIYRRPLINWVDVDGPDINIKGNTLTWEGNVTGTIRAEFGTVYDVITIYVTGIVNTQSTIVSGSVEDSWLGTGWYSGSETGEELTDVQDTECNVLAFYHYQYEELTLSKPEDDESIEDGMANALCLAVGSVIVEPPSDPDYWACYHRCNDRYDENTDDWNTCHEGCEEPEEPKECWQPIEYTTICDCGGAEGSVTEKIPAACGPTGSSSILPTKEGGARYIDCGADEVNDPDYYESKCCVPPPFALPKCKDHYGPWTGTVSESRKEDIKNNYGDNVRIISVGPAEGRCGDTITTQKISSTNCCDEVAELENWGGNPTEMAAEQTAKFCVVGGQAPFTWQCSQGYVFIINNSQQLKTNDSCVYVKATHSACTNGQVRVSDGCSEIRIPIGRSDVPEENIIISNHGPIVPGESFLLTASGGVGEHTWTAEGATLDASFEASAYFTADEDACGYICIQVRTDCGQTGHRNLKSSVGAWVEIGFEPCEYPRPNNGCYDEHEIDWPVEAPYHNPTRVFVGNLAVTIEMVGTSVQLPGPCDDPPGDCEDSLAGSPAWEGCKMMDEGGKVFLIYPEGSIDAGKPICYNAVCEPLDFWDGRVHYIRSCPGTWCRNYQTMYYYNELGEEPCTLINNQWQACTQQVSKVEEWQCA